MPTSSACNSQNRASDVVGEDGELGRREESGSEPDGRRGVLPGLPGGAAMRETEPEISDDVLDALLAGARTAQEIAGPDGVLAHLTRRLMHRALEAELTEHLGYEAGQAPASGTGNSRNGKPGKTVLTDHGRRRAATGSSTTTLRPAIPATPISFTAGGEAPS